MSTVTTSPIIEGIEFILRYTESPIFSGTPFPKYCNLWPKIISTSRTEGAQIRVDYYQTMLNEFRKADLEDCRIRVYPDYVKEHWSIKATKECYTIGGRGVPVSLLLLDLDKGQFHGDLELLLQALYKTLDNINNKFQGNFKPGIVWSGNGYHIYLPVQLYPGNGDSWCLNHIDKLTDLIKDPDREFLRWSERYLTNKMADPQHSKTVSLKNCLLRVPGSINSKNGQEVKILQYWDGQRPFINHILRAFYRYLVDKKLKPQKPIESFEFSTDWSKNK